MKAILVLEDGRVFRGYSFGATGETFGEVVFNTSMAGYQEIITDPSYKGQIVTMTYPLIGNYGVNSEDVESRKPFLEGFVVREASRIVSNWRSEEHLSQYLKRNKIIGMEGVDTRALTKHIRTEGAMKAVISTKDIDVKRLLRKAKASPGLVGLDLAKEVTCKKAFSAELTDKNACRSIRSTVVVIDCGVKFSILKELAKRGCCVKVVPADTGAEDILSLKPDGLVLSNGPGDPAAVTYVVKTARELIGKLPVFGICLGHQIMGLVFGGKTYKLKFGHHGGNHPVKDLKTGKVSITSQNHGFCVDIDTLSRKDVEVTHMNLNDNTLEGMRHKKYPVFSVQFHPEAGPGPNDAKYLFEEFITCLKDKTYTRS